MDSQRYYIDSDGYPVCKPFDSLSEVLLWYPNEHVKVCGINGQLLTSKRQEKDEHCINSEIISPMKVDSQQTATYHRKSAASRPQILVCHDMNGGYLNDRLISF